MVGIAMSPKADNPRLDPNFLGDGPGAVPSRRQKNNPCTLQITLQCYRRAATSFQHLAILAPKAHFSCFGNHPDLESRLTFQEKWVLDNVRPDLGVFYRRITRMGGGLPLGRG